MKKNVKKVIKIITCLLISICICSVFFMHKSNADAGHHTSHHSSSSHSSSSSRSRSRSSSSSSSRSSSRTSSSSSSSDEGTAIGFAIYIIVIVIIIIVTSKKSNKVSSMPKLKNNLDEIDKIKKVIPDFNEKKFLKNGYDMFLKIENAWMNLDMEDVHNLITDEMFNMYDSQLDMMKVKNEQNIMSDFVLKDSAITGFLEQNDTIEIKTQYIIEFYDYIIDKDSKKVTSGNKSRKVRMHYEFTFIKNKDENSKIDVCPCCGAKVDVNSAGTCEYCGSKIIGNNSNWVMAKKICLRQDDL